MRIVSPLPAVAALVLLAPIVRAQTPLPAETVIQKAVQTARKSNRSIFVHFSASWCGWCHKLEAALADPSIKKLFDKAFVVVALDTQESGEKKSLENPGADTWMARMGGEKAGLPFLVFLDKTGKKVADSNVMPGNQNIGYPAAPEEITAFGNLLRKTAPKLTAAEIDTILAYLQEHAPKPRPSGQ
jgi:uncharacterized protein YyaL (SSP411 family)